MTYAYKNVFRSELKKFYKINVVNYAFDSLTDNRVILLHSINFPQIKDVMWTSKRKY